jgi:hypothetical protein
MHQMWYNDNVRQNTKAKKEIEMQQKMKYQVGDLVRTGFDEGLDLPEVAMGRDGMVVATHPDDPGVYDVAIGSLQIVVTGITWYQMEAVTK